MQQDVLQHKFNWICSFWALTFSQWNSSSAVLPLSFWCRLSWICVPKGQGLLARLLGCGILGRTSPCWHCSVRTKDLEPFSLRSNLAKPPQLLTSPESAFQTSVNSTERLRCHPCPLVAPCSPCQPSGWPGRAPQSWDLCLGLGNGFLQSRLGGFKAQSL